MAEQSQVADGDEVFGHVAIYLDQVLNLSRALQTVLEAEREAPIEGDQVTALAKALERASEDAQSVFEAYYHPKAGQAL